MFGGDLRFNTAPALAVARDYDLPLDIDSLLRQVIVIFRNAVIHVHQRSSYVARGRIGVIGRQLACLRRRFVFGDGRFFERRFVLDGTHQLQNARGRIRQQSLEILDARIQTEFL